MALKEVDRGIKRPGWVSNIDWFNVRFFFTALAVICLVGFAMYYVTQRPDWPDHNQISKIEVGMDEQEVFDILGEKGWEEYDESGFGYEWNFHTPSGVQKTFWITIKNGVVIDIYTI